MHKLLEYKMRTALLIALCFATLGVTLTADGKDSKSPRKKVQGKSKVEGKEQNVEIPPLEQLTIDTDPIELGQKIKNIPDKASRNRLIRKLKKMASENKNSLPGKFYQAAFASITNKEKASKLWAEKLQETTKNLENSLGTIIDKRKDNLGVSFQNIKDIMAADPVGMASEKGESILLTVLSDSIKNLGKISDTTYDALLNGSAIVDALTSPVDMVPFANIVKKNVHNNLESGLQRGRYIAGSFADDGSKTLETAAKNAEQRAEAKQSLLRGSVSKKRSLNI